MTTAGEGLPDGPDTDLREIDEEEAAPPTDHPRTHDEDEQPSPPS